MNHLDRLAGFSSQLMTLTGFFHGVLRMDQMHASAGRTGPGARTNIARYHILKCLDGRKVCRATEVSDVLNIKKNTLSELLDRMVRDGQVRRAFATDDRRVTLLRITPQGRTSIRDFENGLMEKLEQYLAGLARDDREDLVRAIESLARILERHDRPAGSTSPF